MKGYGGYAISQKVSWIEYTPNFLTPLILQNKSTIIPKRKKKNSRFKIPRGLNRLLYSLQIQ